MQAITFSGEKMRFLVLKRCNKSFRAVCAISSVICCAFRDKKSFGCTASCRDTIADAYFSPSETTCMRAGLRIFLHKRIIECDSCFVQAITVRGIIIIIIITIIIIILTLFQLSFHPHFQLFHRYFRTFSLIWNCFHLQLFHHAPIDSRKPKTEINFAVVVHIIKPSKMHCREYTPVLPTLSNFEICFNSALVAANFPNKSANDRGVKMIDSSVVSPSSSSSKSFSWPVASTSMLKYHSTSQHLLALLFGPLREKGHREWDG